MMKKYWRKMMALTCAAAMLFTMAGCGNAEGTTDGAETAQSSTTADGPERSRSSLQSMLLIFRHRSRICRRLLLLLKKVIRGLKLILRAKKCPSIIRRWLYWQEKISFRMYFGWSRQPQRSLHRMVLYDLTDALDQYGINDSFFPDWCIHVPLTAKMWECPVKLWW